MLYHEALQNMGKEFDPFMHIKAKEAVQEYDAFFVIPARSPYVSDHLLIIPKRKVYLLGELTPEEQKALFAIAEERTTKLHKHHDSVNLLLRDGLVGGKSGKSINHLHFHLIPDIGVSSQASFASEKRPRYNDDEYQQVAQSIRNTYA